VPVSSLPVPVAVSPLPVPVPVGAVVPRPRRAVPGEAADDLDLVVRVGVDVRDDAAAREAAGRLPTPAGRLDR